MTMVGRWNASHWLASLGSAALLCAGCGSDGSDDDHAVVAEADADALLNRAYVVSEMSDDLFVVDLQTMEEIAKIDIRVGGPGINQNHMAILSEDGGKLYVTATAKDSIAVVDARKLSVAKTIKIGPHNTHANTCFGCGPDKRDELWVVNEGGEDHPGTVSVIDMATDEVVETIEDPSFVVPHNVRFSGRRAYVPSIGGNQISVVDMDTYKVTETLLTEGETEPGACSADPCGYADAQIDGDGVLFAAHIETGKVLVYDTRALERKQEIPMGFQPWSVFVDELSNDFDTHLMPNWGDSTVSIMDRKKLSEVSRSQEGDQESYGINYSPLAPGEAFVLNRIKEAVAVIDRESGELIERIDVGGTTETAATTADGKHLLLPISSSNSFLVLDVETHEEVARFENVGVYPWSVGTVGGQNYCH